MNKPKTMLLSYSMTCEVDLDDVCKSAGKSASDIMSISARWNIIYIEFNDDSVLEHEFDQSAEVDYKFPSHIVVQDENDDDIAGSSTFHSDTVIIRHAK